MQDQNITLYQGNTEKPKLCLQLPCLGKFTHKLWLQTPNSTKNTLYDLGLAQKRTERHNFTNMIWKTQKGVCNCLPLENSSRNASYSTLA